MHQSNSVGRARLDFEKLTREQVEEAMMESEAGFRIITEATFDAMAALRESEARFRTVFSDTALGIALVDLTGRVLESNPALQAMLGYSEAELRSLKFTDWTVGEDAVEDWRLFEKLIRGEIEHYQLEKRYAQKDGRMVSGNATVSLVRGADRQPSFAIRMIQNVTDGITGQPSPATLAMPKGHEIVLLVEDNTPLRELAGFVLRDLGYTVLEAVDGEDAMRVFDHNDATPIDLLLTDVLMPQMDGRELADRLVATSPGTRVLFTSGYVDNPAIEREIEQSKIAFLPKPFTPAALAQRVRQILDHPLAALPVRRS